MSDQPPPPYGGPPPGQWGPPSQWGQQPPPPRPPGGLPVWGQVLAGAGIGLVLGGVLMGVVLAFLATSGSADISGETIFALVVLVPLACPVPLLVFRHTRMWAVGLLIGIGLTTISLAGGCALIINGLSEGSV